MVKYQPTPEGLGRWAVSKGNVSDRLPPDQKAELYEILGKYPEVLCDELGKT